MSKGNKNAQLEKELRARNSEVVKLLQNFSSPLIDGIRLAEYKEKATLDLETQLKYGNIAQEQYYHNLNKIEKKTKLSPEDRGIKGELIPITDKEFQDLLSKAKINDTAYLSNTNNIEYIAYNYALFANEAISDTARAIKAADAAIQVLTKIYKEKEQQEKAKKDEKLKEATRQEEVKKDPKQLLIEEIKLNINSLEDDLSSRMDVQPAEIESSINALNTSNRIKLEVVEDEERGGYFINMQGKELKHNNKFFNQLSVDELRLLNEGIKAIHTEAQEINKNKRSARSGISTESPFAVIPPISKDQVRISALDALAATRSSGEKEGIEGFGTKGTIGSTTPSRAASPSASSVSSTVDSGNESGPRSRSGSNSSTSSKGSRSSKSSSDSFGDKTGQLGSKLKHYEGLIKGKTTENINLLEGYLETLYSEFNNILPKEILSSSKVSINGKNIDYNSKTGLSGAIGFKVSDKDKVNRLKAAIVLVATKVDETMATISVDVDAISALIEKNNAVKASIQKNEKLNKRIIIDDRGNIELDRPLNKEERLALMQIAKNNTTNKSANAISPQEQQATASPAPAVSPRPLPAVPKMVQLEVTENTVALQAIDILGDNLKEQKALDRESLISASSSALGSFMRKGKVTLLIDDNSNNSEKIEEEGHKVFATGLEKEKFEKKLMNDCESWINHYKTKGKLHPDLEGLAVVSWDLDKTLLPVSLDDLLIARMRIDDETNCLEYGNKLAERDQSGELKNKDFLRKLILFEDKIGSNEIDIKKLTHMTKVLEVMKIIQDNGVPNVIVSQNKFGSKVIEACLEIAAEEIAKKQGLENHKDCKASDYVSDIILMEDFRFLMGDDRKNGGNYDYSALVNFKSTSVGKNPHVVLALAKSDLYRERLSRRKENLTTAPSVSQRPAAFAIDNSVDSSETDKSPPSSPVPERKSPLVQAPISSLNTSASTSSVTSSTENYTTKIHLTTGAITKITKDILDKIKQSPEDFMKLKAQIHKCIEKPGLGMISEIEFGSTFENEKGSINITFEKLTPYTQTEINTLRNELSKPKKVQENKAPTPIGNAISKNIQDYKKSHPEEAKKDNDSPSLNLVGVTSIQNAGELKDKRNGVVPPPSF